MSRHEPAIFVAAAALVLSLVADPAHACRRGACGLERSVVVESEVFVGPPVAVVAPERVMVTPGRVDEIITSPETVTVYEEIDMQPAGYAWEYWRCPPGKRRCKVFVPAESKFVEREIVVRPGRRISVVTPPAYAWRRRVMALEPSGAYVVDRRVVSRGRLRARDIIPPGGWIGW